MSCETGGIQKGPSDSFFFTEEQVKAIRDFFEAKSLMSMKLLKVQNINYKLPGLNIESIDVLRAALTPEEFKGFCKGNALKYLIRAGKKDDELQDLKKAGVYIGWCIDAQSTSKSK